MEFHEWQGTQRMEFQENGITAPIPAEHYILAVETAE